MSMVFHYDDTPVPVGNPVRANGNDNAYSLGLCDGGDLGEQWLDEPEQTVTFFSPDGAREWLEAVTAVLTPYIESGDREHRAPDPEGWLVPGEDQE